MGLVLVRTLSLPGLTSSCPDGVDTYGQGDGTSLPNGPPRSDTERSQSGLNSPDEIGPVHDCFDVVEQRVVSRTTLVLIPHARVDSVRSQFSSTIVIVALIPSKSTITVSCLIISGQISSMAEMGLDNQ